MWVFLGLRSAFLPCPPQPPSVPVAIAWVWVEKAGRQTVGSLYRWWPGISLC